MHEDEMATSHLRICKARRRRSERLAVGRRRHLCADAGMTQAGGADPRTRGRAPQRRPGSPAAASPRAADLHTAASRLHNRAGRLITAGNHMRTSSLPAVEACWCFFSFIFSFLIPTTVRLLPPPVQNWESIAAPLPRDRWIGAAPANMEADLQMRSN